MEPEEIEALRRRLRSRPRTLQYTHISRDTGLTVRWLSEFLNGKRKPHRSFCRTLAKYLDDSGVSA